MNQFCIPDTSDISNESLWQWYGNVLTELEHDFLTTDEKNYMKEYYLEAGLLQWWREPFFRRHFVESFTDAARYLLGSSAQGAIVDLGCGTGTQSLFLALGGAKVLGLDMDAKALEIFRKRREFLENKLGRSLDIEIHEGDVFRMDLGSLGPIRGVYSMFAFNMMQPSSRLLDIIAPHMVKGSRFVVIDGNSQSLFARFWPGRQRQVWSPAEFSKELADRSFSVAKHEGCVALPPRFWRALPYSALATIDRTLCRNMTMAVSHQVMGELVIDNLE